MKRGHCPFCDGKLKYKKNTSKRKDLILRAWECEQCEAKGVEHIHHTVLELPKAVSHMLKNRTEKGG